MKFLMMLFVFTALALPVGAAQGEAKQQEQQSQGEDAQKNQSQGEDAEKNQSQGEDAEKNQSQGEDAEKNQSQGEDAEKNQSQGEDCEKNQSQGEDAEKNQSQGEDCEKNQNQGEDAEKNQNQGEDAEKNQSQGEDCEKNQNQGEDAEKNQNQGEDAEKNQSQGEDADPKQMQGPGGEPGRNQNRNAEKNRYREREYSCPGCQAIADLPAGEVDEDEEADLVYTREEEKLARDVYRALFEEHRKKIFRKIARSEERHMAAVLVILEKYEFEDPVGDNPEGTFGNEDLEDLYSEFVTDGLKSLKDALVVGVTIEEMDIADLTAAKENADDADLILIYEYLLRGSRNHLRAFLRQLGKLDSTYTYTPQYLTQEEFDAIASTPKESGRKLLKEVRAISRHRRRH